jgi:hypothetical protein
LFVSHPWFGVGFGQFPAARLSVLHGIATELEATHPHNVFLELLAEWGCAGLATVLLPLYWIARSVYKEFGSKVGGQMFLPLALVSTILTYAQFEYPFWYASYLLAFAFLLGLLPQPAVTLRLEVRRWAIIGTLLWAFGLVLLSASIVDWWRLTRIYDDFNRQLSMNGSRGVVVDREIGGVTQMTLLPYETEFMYLRTLGPDGLLLPYKIEVAYRVLHAHPSSEALARCVALLVGDRRQAEATNLLDNIRQRNSDMEQAAVQRLLIMAESQKALADFLKARR